MEQLEQEKLVHLLLHWMCVGKEIRLEHSEKLHLIGYILFGFVDVVPIGVVQWMRILAQSRNLMFK